MSDKLPAFQFYTGDWMKDPALRSCSLAAQGLWINMLCLMHESHRRGALQHATGKPVTAEQLARMTGCSTDDASRLLQELEDSGVFSRDGNGVIYSRRMVEDERRRAKNRANGAKGGNPKLVWDNPPDNRSVIPTPNRRGNRDPTPSSSSSISSSEKNSPLPPAGGDGVEIPPELDSEPFRAVWSKFTEHRREIKHKLTPTSSRTLLGRLAQMGQQRAIAAIEHSIANGWQGVFENAAEGRRTSTSNGRLFADARRDQRRSGEHASAVEVTDVRPI